MRLPRGHEAASDHRRGEELDAARIGYYGIVRFSSTSSTREGWMAGGQGDMECPECMDLLADYVDGSLPRNQAELLEWHLEGCGPCVAFVRTYKGTVDAARRLRETTLPPELKEKLRAFLKRSVQQ
jgi:hypothetical protein